MIDTVLLRHCFKKPLNKRVLEKFRWRNERYYFRDAAGENPPCLFYYPSRDGKFYLAAEASLPKVLYGHNLPVLDDEEIILALGKLSTFASERFEVNFDAASAKVGRVDFCANFNVGEDKIYAYLKAAAEAAPARLKRRIIGKIETVEFFNDQRKIYLYDKSRQSQLLLKRGKISAEEAAAASGILRLEARFSNPVVIQRLFVEKLKLPDRKAATVLSLVIAKHILTESLSNFELDKPIVTINRRVEKLQQSYGYGRKLQQLLGFLQLCHIYGQGNLIDRGIVNRSSYYKYMEQLKDANCLTYTTYHTPLKALSVR